MTHLLLAEAYSGRAQRISTEDYTRRIGNSPRGMIAAMMSIRFQKSVIFSLGPEERLYAVYNDDDPSWHSLAWDDFTRDALRLDDFEIRDGRLVPKPPPGEDEDPSEHELHKYRFEAQHAFPCNASLMIIATSADEAQEIVETELKRIQGLSKEQLEADPFWKLILDSVDDSCDSFFDTLNYLHRGEIDIKDGPHRLSASNKEPVNIPWEDPGDD